jgi:hypothetical protein
MSDIFAIFGFLLFLGIAFPGLLATWYSLFNTLIWRTSEQIESTPWSSFFWGILILFICSVPILIFLALPVGFLKAIGWILLGVLLSFASLGASGFALLISKRISDSKNNRAVLFGSFIKGAVVLELAAAFPFIGWFFVIPIVTIMSLGAITIAIFRKKGQEQLATSSEKTEMELEAHPL